LPQIKKYQSWPDFIGGSRRERKLAEMDFAKHVMLFAGIVNGIFRGIVAKKLLVSALTPLGIVTIVRRQNDNSGRPRFRQLIRNILGNFQDLGTA
jgi:hypothetical protein